MSIETVDQRIARLLKLRTEVDADIARLTTLREQVASELARLFNAEATGKRRHRPRHVIPDCGTESGYQRHNHRGETCEPCRVAHANYERARSAARREAS